MGSMRDLTRSQWIRRWAIPVALFALAFLPRMIYPVSWPMQWYTRAIEFGDAVLAGEWSHTFQRYHPGVTTMWLSGVGLRLFSWRHGLSSEEMMGTAPTKPGLIDSAVSAGVLPVALFISVSIVLAYLVLRRTVGRRAAVAAGVLIALDPLYLTHSKMIHVNGLLTACMFLSVLFLLDFIRRKRLYSLVLSGLFAGLSFLTKSPSIFLAPYALLLVGFHRLTSRRGEPGRGSWTDRLVEILRDLFIWGGCAGLVFFVLWPAMWVEPLEVFRRIVDKLIFHVETTHYNPVFFNQESSFEDPGVLFYLVTIGWKTTLVTLPLSLAGALFTLRRVDGDERRWVTWSLIVYAGFFTLQMSLGGWKQIAYLVPIFPAIDVIAALGLVEIAASVARRVRPPGRMNVSAGLIVLPLLLQAVVVLPRHPYYGTHHNALLGGSGTARHVLPLQNQNEGLDLAAAYLNDLPRAQRATAGLHQRGAATFRYEFIGLTTTLDEPGVDYRVYFLNHVMRQLDIEQWREQWEKDRKTEPLYTVAFDGVEYVWVYGTPPDEPAMGGPEYSLGYRLGEHITLDRVRIESSQVPSGEPLTVAPVWRADGQIDRSFKVFCHVLSPEGELVAQQDGLPLSGLRPTQTWRAGEAIEDSYEIAVGVDVPSGAYELSIGMYDPNTMNRVPVYDSTGQRVPHDRIVVGDLWIGSSESNRE